jgi:hypothetical protein
LHSTDSSVINNNLLYRRQYFIGPKFVDRFKSWNKIKVGKNLHITAHPDLTITTLKKSGAELALLGFMFDSKNYKKSIDDILRDIAKDSKSFNDVTKATYRYAGRWILIYTSKKEAKIFNDPGGLRQVFYTDYDSNIWCSAQPHIHNLV